MLFFLLFGAVCLGGTLQDSPQPQPGPAGFFHSQGVRAAVNPSEGPFPAAGTLLDGACESAAYKAPVTMARNVNEDLRKHSKTFIMSTQQASVKLYNGFSISSLTQAIKQRAMVQYEPSKFLHYLPHLQTSETDTAARLTLTLLRHNLQ